MRWKTRKLLELVELEVRELLKSYKFPGDEIPVVRGSALGALNGEEKWEKSILELMTKVDDLHSSADTGH